MMCSPTYTACRRGRTLVVVDESTSLCYHESVRQLYYGDNLIVLRRYIKDESVDLIYLDPPFNSARDYNILFREQSGEPAQAQIRAFSDTWQWSERAYHQFIEECRNDKLRKLVTGFVESLGRNEMTAYLVMMAPRLVELHRVLKPTGSIYLHCDPTASHYLKVMMDTIFDARNFRNEVVWKRTSAHSGAKRWGPVHDILLFYTKSDEYTWNQQHTAYDERYIAKNYRYVDERTGKRYRVSDLTGPGIRHGPSGQPWRGYDPSKVNRHWQPPSYCYNKYKEITGEDLAQYPLLERLDRLDKVGLIHWPQKEGGMPGHKRFLEDVPGVPYKTSSPMYNLYQHSLQNAWVIQLKNHLPCWSASSRHPAMKVMWYSTRSVDVEPPLSPRRNSTAHG